MPLPRHFGNPQLIVELQTRRTPLNGLLHGRPSKYFQSPKRESRHFDGVRAPCRHRCDP
jgi:hypothetical protein